MKERGRAKLERQDEECTDRQTDRQTDGQIVKSFLYRAGDIEFCSFHLGEPFNDFKEGQVINRIIYKNNHLDIPV